MSTIVTRTQMTLDIPINVTGLVSNENTFQIHYSAKFNPGGAEFILKGMMIY